MVVIADGFGGDVDLNGISTHLVKVGSDVSNTIVDRLVKNIDTDIFSGGSFDEVNK